jgi:hypothetical protein
LGVELNLIAIEDEDAGQALLLVDDKVRIRLPDVLSAFAG